MWLESILLIENKTPKLSFALEVKTTPYTSGSMAHLAKGREILEFVF